jgi:aspartyl-tRNA(Asn)/glutamyl-tRNA(Gln) amidotransferase subunit C
MALSKEQVQKIADLARLGLTDAEIEKFTGQLSGILDWVDMLSEVDTEGVEPTYQSTGLTNVVDADEVQTNEQGSPEELLQCSELSLEARQILVKNVF